MLGFALVGLVLAAIGVLVVRTGPATLVSVGVATQILNGNAGQLGFPIAPDRLFIFAGLGWLAVTNRPQRLRVTGVHLMLFTTAGIGIVSAMWAGTFRSAEGFFGLLDRLGVVPFALFALAPLLYRDRDERRRFLTIFLVVGAYLSVTAFLEFLDFDQLLFPAYIGDPSVGLHADRARGPFAESVAMGLGLLDCAILMYVARSTFREQLGRRIATIVGIACVLATILTLTRAVWLAVVVAAAVLLVLDSRARRYVVFIVPMGALSVFLLFSLVPALSSSVGDRAAEQEPVWDRLNTNDAAIRAIQAHPWTGIGWDTFAEKSPDYLEQRDDIPLTGEGIAVHNVPLGHAVELGIFGAAVWAATMVTAIGGVLLRRTIAEFRIWRYAGLAVAAAWTVVAMFGPLGYPLANSMVWLVAGIAGTPRALVESPKVEEEQRAVSGNPS